MATGGTAVLSDPSRPLLDHDDSSMSSPLSEVEDKDASNDDMDMEFTSSRPHHTETSHGQRGDGTSHSPSDDSSGSNLSDLDVNDSEAETERLYDTPRKNHNIRDTVVLSTESGQKHAANGTERIFERSPSKLQQQIQADLDAENGGDDGDDDDDDDELSDEPQEENEHEDDVEHGSVAYSEEDSDDKDLSMHKKFSQSPRHTSQESQIVVRSTIVENRKDDSTRDTRKRKRSPRTEPSEPDQPVRKRTGSVIDSGDEHLSHDKTSRDEDGQTASVDNKSAEHSSEEEAPDGATKNTVDDVADSIENSTSETSRSKKSKRSNSKKRKGPDDEIVEGAYLDTMGPVAGEHSTAEDERAGPGVDEEAEAAHRNEEELERKRAAFEQLTAIEKHFTAFRDRLYEERLAQLDEEEAMLTADNPTHPEYLAMMQCIDSRRDERLKVSEIEYKYNMDSLERWAVARRAQILSQFYQSVRETREKALEELGQQWYEIQHERRRHANTTPDYGFRFPKSGAQQKKQAIAHSKETSILAGVAQNQGFPAAPNMKGANSMEIDDDLEAIHRARALQQQPSYQEIGGLSFRRSIGPAGEQFLEQTPWANPNHPSHHKSQPGNRRHSHQPSSTLPHGHSAIHANSRPNGELLQKNPAAANVATEHEHAHALRPPKVVAGAKSKREAAPQA